MNTTEVKGNWNEQKGKLKQKFAELTDNDLMFAEGKKEEMMAKIQIKLGKTKEELFKIISSLSSSLFVVVLSIFMIPQKHKIKIVVISINLFNIYKILLITK